MSFNRTLGNLGKAIDSASAGTFLQRDDATDVDFVSIEYSDLSGTPTALDSAAATNLIDSAYIQLRQGSLGGGGLDSAAVTTLVDSNYVSARTTNLSSGFFMYDYVATAGQTTFQDSDANGNILSYGNGGILVFYNGVLMRRGFSYDYSEGSNSITLNSAADSAANITIAKWTYTDGDIDLTWYGDRGIVVMNSDTNSIDYFDITTPGNSQDFGDLTSNRRYAGTGGATNRGLIVAGNNIVLKEISYITPSTPGNAVDFGDTGSFIGYCFCASTGVHLVYYVGTGASPTSTLEYVTIATTGNGSTFGNLTYTTYGFNGTGTDGTYALVAGGFENRNNIDYFIPATPGNASDFGDLTSVAGNSVSGVSDFTYTVFGGRNNNVLDYVTTATPSNATDFGDLTGTRSDAGTTGNGTRGCFVGAGNYIEYITIASPGNATDFGDLTFSSSMCQNGQISGAPS